MPNPYHVRLAISQYGDQFRAELFTEDLGDTDGDLLPAKWDILDDWAPFLVLGATSLPPDAARKVGKQLFEFMFGKAENSKKWRDILDQVRRQGRGLRLLIDATTDTVRDLPYGLLCEQHDDFFLFRPSRTRQAIQFVRILRRCTPRPLKLRKPIRVLLAAAEPESPDVSRVGCAERLCELARGVAAVVDLSVVSREGAQPIREVIPGPVETWKPEQFEQFCRTTRDQLRTALERGDFDVLHLIGHGQASGLLLCDSGGGKSEVTSGELGEWCGASKLQMAFLQVCGAARTDGRGGFGGLAQQLLNPNGGNLAAVVASPYPLDAERSTPAAIVFYQRLAGGASPDAALERGLEETNWTWALLELWVRPSALSNTGVRGAFQFASPYCGLARFEERDHDIFFGREGDVAELRQILQAEPVVMVAGDSGSGKSSLLQAGLAHHVRQHGLAGISGWRIVTLRPGRDPGKNLVASLLLGDEARGTDLPAPGDWPRALRVFLAGVCGGERPLLVLLDQFEEMFTLCNDVAQRHAVADALAEVARQTPYHFRLVLGMRSDYLGSAVALPGLCELIKRPWVLRPPGPDDIHTIVAGPAASYGYEFQGPVSDDNPCHQQGLLERILSDPLLTAGASHAVIPGATPPMATAPLPLLEFALERLWLMAVDRGSREFSHADYDQLGGLGGAIAQHAEEVYKSLPTHLDLGADSQKLAEAIFTGVISSRGTRRPRPRSELEAETGNAAGARRVTDHLVGERLLTIRSDPNNLAVTQVDIAHEVLIDRWGRLKAWLAENPETRALKEEFQRDAEKWDQGMPGTPPRSWWNLPSPTARTRYVAWLDATKPALTDTQSGFADALRDSLRRRRLLLTTGVAAVFLVAAAMTVLARVAWNKADEAEIAGKQASWNADQFQHAAQEARQNQDKAERNAQSEKEQRILAERAKKKAREHLYVGHIKLAQEAWERGQVAKLRELLDRQQPDAEQEDLRGFEWYYLWRLSRSSGLFTLDEHQNAANCVAFSGDGKILASGSEDGTLILWDVATGEEIRDLRLTFGGIGVILAAENGEIVVKNLIPGGAAELDHRLQPNDRIVAASGPDGGMIQTTPMKLSEVVNLLQGEPDTEVELEVLSPGEQAAKRFALIRRAIQSDKAHRAALTSMTFSSEGRLASADRLGTIRLWNPASGEVLRAIPAHKGAIDALVFSADAKTLASAGRDETAALWNAATGQKLKMLELKVQDPLKVSSLAFSHDGKNLASGTSAGAIRLWDLATGQAMSTYFLGTVIEISAVAFAPDARALASGTSDGSVSLWDLGTGQVQATFQGHSRDVLSIAFSPDGKTLATSSSDGTVKIWNLATRQEQATLKGHTDRVNTLAFAPDGITLATGSSDGSVIVWNSFEEQDSDSLRGRFSGVASLAFSSDSKLLATSGGRLSNDPQYVTAELRLWDASTGQASASWQEPAEAILALEFSPDGTSLACCHSDPFNLAKPGTVDLWDVAGKQLRATLRSEIGPVFSLAFSPDGRSLATGGGNILNPSSPGELKLWDAATGQLRANLTGPSGAIAYVSFSANGETLAAISGTLLSTSAPVVVTVWDVTQGKILWTSSPDPHVGFGDLLWAVATFSRDGKMLASGHADGTVKLWGVDTAEVQATFGAHTAPVISLAFSTDGDTLATGSGDLLNPGGPGEVKLWDAATGSLRADFKGKPGALNKLVFSQDGTLLAAVRNYDAVEFWEIASGQVRSSLKGVTGRVHSATFSPDGQVFATGSLEGILKLWDVATGQEQTMLSTRPQAGFHGHTSLVWTTAFSPDGKTLATGSADKTVKIWDVATGQVRTTFPAALGGFFGAGHSDQVASVAFSPDGMVLATGSYDDTVKLWDTSKGQLRATLRGHSKDVNSLAFAPDGKTLATASDDHTVKLWDVATEQVRTTLEGHSDLVLSVAFSPDATTLASGARDGVAKLWDMETGKVRATLSGHTASVASVAFSPDGKTLATASYDKTVKLWQVATGEELMTLRRHTGSVLFVAFSPDGKTLASAGESALAGEVKLWRAATEEELRDMEIDEIVEGLLHVQDE